MSDELKPCFKCGGNVLELIRGEEESIIECGECGHIWDIAELWNQCTQQKPLADAGLVADALLSADCAYDRYRRNLELEGKEDEAENYYRWLAKAAISAIVPSEAKLDDGLVDILKECHEHLLLEGYNNSDLCNKVVAAISSATGWLPIGLYKNDKPALGYTDDNGYVLAAFTGDSIEYNWPDDYLGFVGYFQYIDAPPTANAGKDVK